MGKRCKKGANSNYFAPASNHGIDFRILS